MALVFTYVYTKRAEYSEYERDRNVIDVVVYFDKDQVEVDDSFTIDIRKSRRDKDEVVATETYTFASIPPPLDRLSFTFDMTRIRDADNNSVRLMRRGWYLAHAEDVLDEDNNKQSEDFRVSLISVEQIKSQWLHGIPLIASDLLAPTRQPIRVTGVTVSGVSLKHPANSYPLTLNVGSGGTKMLSWAGGESFALDLSHPLYPPKEYYLPGNVGAAGVKVLVDPLSLPDSDVAEMINIDVAKLDDETIGDLIANAVDLIENTDLQIYLEPTLCVTEIDPTAIADTVVMDQNTDYDRITPEITYHGVSPGHWADIQFPFQYLLQIDYLMGSIANNRVISVRTEWAEKSYHSGFVQLVPLQMEMAFNYLALMWAPSLWGIRDLPNFWHYRAKAGLREVPKELLELIARRAAISVLSIAGQAYKGGFAATSISREGVAESVSYTSSAMYGIYSAYINDHERWINERLALIRNKYRGIQMRVL